MAQSILDGTGSGYEAKVNEYNSLHVTSLDSTGSSIDFNSKKLFDTGNSTTTPLGIGGSFVGSWIDTTNYILSLTTVITDQDAATDGLRFEVSNNGSTVLHPHVFSPTANSPNGHHYPTSLEAQYFRVNYTNGSTAQSTFVVDTTLFKDAPEEGHTHPVNYSIDDDHPAPIVKAVLTGKNPSNSYVNVQTTTAGNLKTSTEEWESVVINYANIYPAGTGSNGAVTLTLADTAYAVPTVAPTNSAILTLQNQDDTTIYIGYQNTSSNGVALYSTGDANIKLGPGQQVYAYCGSAGKVITYTLKEVQ